MEQGTSKTHAENMLMSMFKLQQKSYLTDVTIVCKDGLLYGESIQKFFSRKVTDHLFCNSPSLIKHSSEHITVIRVSTISRYRIRFLQKFEQ